MHYNFELELDRVSGSNSPDIETWEKDEYLNRGIWIFLKQRYGVDPTTNRGFETDQTRISQLSSLHIKSPELQPAVIPIDLGNGRYEVRLNALGESINGQYYRYLFLTDAQLTAIKHECSKLMQVKNWRTDKLKTVYNDASWLWRRVLANFGRSTYLHPYVLPVTSNQDPDVTADLLPPSQNRFNQDELNSLYLDTTDKFGEPQFTIKEVFLSYIKYPNRVFFGGYNHIDGDSTIDTPAIHCDIDEAFHDEIVHIAVGLAREDLQDQLGMQVSMNRTQTDKTT